MSVLRHLRAGFRRLANRDADDRDLDVELEQFIEASTEAHIRAGMTPEEAARAARLEVGNLTGVKEEVRASGWEAALEVLWQDIVYGARTLRRGPGFSLVAVSTLGLAIGVSTVMFSTVNSVILRPLPYVDPDRLLVVWTDDAARGLHENATSYLTVADWKRRSHSIADFAIWRGNRAVVLGDESERVGTAFASANLFSILGIRPALGRFLTEADETAHATVAVISYGLWQRRFGGSMNVVGQTLLLDGDMQAQKSGTRAVRVVGVAPQGVRVLDADVDLWEPVTTFWRWDRELVERFSGSWRVIARLQPEATRSQAQRELDDIGAALARSFSPPPKDFPGFHVNAVRLVDQMTGRSLRRSLWVLLGAVGFVLLIACVNIANLYLARGASRERELALRAALGADRARILRQLLTECTLLAATAGALGTAIAAGGIRLVVAAAPSGIPRIEETSIDGRVLAFVLGATLTTAILFGLLPAWKASRAAPQSALTTGRGGAIATEHTVRGTRAALLIAEFAIAVILLTGAGLLLRSLARVDSADLGFNARNVLAVRVAAPIPPPGTDERTIYAARERSMHDVVERVGALPGVGGAGAIGDLLVPGDADESITVTEPALAPRAHAELSSGRVSPGFFETMGVKLLAGRSVSRSDALAKLVLMRTQEGVDWKGAAEAVVVNEAFAKAFFPSESPIGRRFHTAAGRKAYWYEIVGVVNDMRRQRPEARATPQYFSASIGGEYDLLIRAAERPLDLTASVRAAMRSVDRNITVVSVGTVEERLGLLSAERRFQTVLLTMFAALALALAALGIYGVMSYSVERRRSELGVRVALGATTSDVLRLIVGEGLRLTLAGGVMGIVGALALTGILKHVLFEVSATDPLAFAGGVASLAVVSLLACSVPALRASRVDPARAMRHE